MINMLNALMEKKNGGTEGCYKQTTGNLKKKSKENARNQKHCNKNEICL